MDPSKYRVPPTGVVREASALGMLLPPIGHAATVSSPVLRRLIWRHYCNRVLELLDTIFRISQKKFRAYGALHFYLRQPPESRAPCEDFFIYRLARVVAC